jgi:hypothetical protein
MNAIRNSIGNRLEKHNELTIEMRIKVFEQPMQKALTDTGFSHGAAFIAGRKTILLT